MANSREIRNRIRSVKNTGKITGTMGMVAANKSSRAMRIIKASRPYTTKLNEVFASVCSDEVKHPLVLKNKAPRGILILITANRGLCGGYNTNLVKLALKERKASEDVIVFGKKGISALRFAGVQVAQSHTDLPDIPDFSSGAEVLKNLVDRYSAGEIGEVRMVYSRFFSAGSQSPVCEQLLPLEVAKATDMAVVSTSGVEPIFSPNRDQLFDMLVPKVVRLNFYRMLLDACTSEHLARQMAMQSASDNATEMVRSLTLYYNRARQAQITTEISEIVGGAEAQN